MLTMADDNDRNRRLVVAIDKATTVAEKNALSAWATQLLDIRANTRSPVQRAWQAIRLTSTTAIVWPTVKIVARELKLHGWDDRSWAARFGITGAALGLAVFGGQAAGVAALGTAIGVPLWVVVGSGGAFAGVLIEEFTRTKGGRPSV
jgi:hypothetical protein